MVAVEEPTVMVQTVYIKHRQIMEVVIMVVVDMALLKENLNRVLQLLLVLITLTQWMELVVVAVEHLNIIGDKIIMTAE